MPPYLKPVCSCCQWRLTNLIAHTHAAAGFTIWAMFDGSAMSSDLGCILQVSTDLQIDLIPRLVGAIHEKRWYHIMVDEEFRLTPGWVDDGGNNRVKASMTLDSLLSFLNGHLLASAVVVFKAHDVILTQIAARLYFDDLERNGAGVGEAVDMAEWDVG
jgi:hypothetical protein